MQVADYVIRFLADRGVSEIYVVYGAANGSLIDTFTRIDTTRYVAVMHEQAGGFAAEGYAKISGRLGVAIATSGPGGMNLVTPIGNCYYDSVPCLFITGQVHTKFQRPHSSLRQIGFQETDIVSIVTPITKYATMVRDPQEIRYELEKAWFLATTGRPGPVLLDLPIDVQKAEVDDATLEGFDADAAQPAYDLETVDRQIDRYVDDLATARRPVLLVGGGVRMSGAVDELRQVMDRLQIPCFPTWNAIDVVTSDHPCYGGRIGTYGGRGRNFGIQNADLLLAIGSRISGRITGGNPASFMRGAKKYVVDVDAALLQRSFQQVPFDENIHCDATIFLRRLLDRVSSRSLPTFGGWTTQVRRWKEMYDPVTPAHYAPSDIVNPYAFMRILSEEMQAGDILVGDCGGNIVTLNHAFETKSGQRTITNNGNSPMGFAFAAAMGAWHGADRGCRVVCTIGDGGFNMNIQELQTLKTYGVPTKTFLINNHIYGITKAFQETNFGGRAEACGPKGYVPPDFVAVCRAYGIHTVVLTSLDDARQTIREVLAYDGPVVCDVNCHEWHTYEPRIFGWTTPIEDMYPYVDRDEFRANMMVDPMPGWEHPEMPPTYSKGAS